MERDDIREALRSELEPIRKELTQVRHYITGNGTPERGMLIRVDRLEQREHSRTWWIRAAVTAAMGAVLTAATAIFK